MVRFLAVKQFQMQVAARFIGEALKELARQAETKCARHVLLLFFARDAFEIEFVQTTPNEVRPAAEIDDASREAFVHRHKAFAAQGAPRIESGSISAQTSFVAEPFCEGLAERDAAVLDRVMRVHFQVALAVELQIEDRVLRKKRQHVIKKRHAGFDRRLAAAINHQLERNLSFLRDALDLRGANLHVDEFKQAKHSDSKAIFGKVLFA